MAFSASALLPNPPKLFPASQIKLFGQRQCRTERCLFQGFRRKGLSKFAVRVSMPMFNDPAGASTPLRVVKEKLVKSIPEPVKDVEWNKASEIFMARLLLLGQKAMKWSIIAFFALSSVSDVVFSIARNQELAIPFGLLAGCLVADLLREISLQVFSSSQGRELNWKLIGIGFFFVFIKSFSGFLGIKGRIFLLHFGNGGLMQVLWLWRNLVQEKQSNVSEQDSSLATDTK